MSVRPATLFLWALPLALTHCGAQQDLVIGEILPVGVQGAAGSQPSRGGESETPGEPSQTGGEGGSAILGPDETGGASAGAATSCATEDEPPSGSLVHRYSFEGTGTTAIDSVSGKDGALMNGVLLDGSGVLTLPGNRPGLPDQYVNLPNGMLSVLTDVSIVVWTAWGRGAGYQRIFDFGVSKLGENERDAGQSYLAVMPATGFPNGTRLGAELAAPGFATLQLPSDRDMLDGVRYQVALVFRSSERVELYRDGALVISSPTDVSLSLINDVNNWIGLSQTAVDHAYRGTYDEFRIYNAALSACQLSTLANRGPDAP